VEFNASISIFVSRLSLPEMKDVYLKGFRSGFCGRNRSYIKDKHKFPETNPIPQNNPVRILSLRWVE
jgi:hypothetical protein